MKPKHTVKDGLNLLREHLTKMGPHDATKFAWDCGTTIGYLRRCICIGRALSLETCSEIERESRGVLTIEDLRPDLELAHLRRRRPNRAA
jgi:DNA-binding transcriptional regulator YdaS (Cro superfamily)